MPALVLNFLGGFQVLRDGLPVTRFRGDKVRALLAYLAMESNRPHTRAVLASLLWPDHPNDRALRNLAQALVRLRDALGDEQGTLLQTSRHTIQWLPGPAVDAAEFARLAQSTDVADLEDAASRYTGEFLAGFALNGCEAFEEWLLLTRERLAQMAVSALDRLTAARLAGGEFEAAAAGARRQLALDPWRETAHQQLMRALAESGDRAGALAAYRRCREVLRGDLGIEPDPSTTALYEQIRATRSSEFSMLSSEFRLAQLRTQNSELKTGTFHNLPAQLTSFVGRERELAGIRQSLASARLVTLAGPGGAGKTRLAIRAAAELADRYHDGACLVDLAALADPGLVLQTVALGLGLREVSSQPLALLLASELRSKQLLLVLDTCEHVVDSCRQLVAHLLQSCAQLSILATSREVLGITGEVVRHVPPLAVPTAQGAETPEQLLEYESVQLFVDRARAARPEFALMQQNVLSVAQICLRLDGIPLALELAAARVRHMSVEAIAARLGDRFNLLAAGSHAALPRHQALRSAVEWSYDLLTGPERVVFRSLAVFSGGFTLHAAEAIASTPDILGDTWTSVVDALALLVDKSLLLADDGDDAMRYRLLETIREYAAERLLASGEEPALRRRHAEYYLALAEQAEPRLQGPDQTAWLDRLEVEHDNLRAALAWSLEDEETGRQGDKENESLEQPVSLSRREVGLRIAAALGEFWWPRGYLNEGRRWLERILDFRSQIADYMNSTQSAIKNLQSPMAKALYRAGELAYGQGDYGPARELLEESLAIYRQSEDKRGEACVLRGLGNVLASQGDEQEAAHLWGQSLALFREAGDSWGIAWMLLETSRAQTDPSRRAALLRESLALARAGGYQRTVATALGNLGKLASLEGAYAHARRLLEEALAIGRRLRDNWICAWMLSELGQLAAREGDEQTAAARLQESLALFRQGGNQSGAALVLAQLGDLARRQGAAQQAGAAYEESLALFRELGDTRQSAEVIGKLEEMERG
jgi:predicted ATPase/DNA-binding SARP family transcriptional activator